MSAQSQRTDRSQQFQAPASEQQQGANREQEGPSNAAAQEQAGLGSGSGGSGGFGVVAELDRGLANRLTNVIALGEASLTEHASTLVGLEGEADVQGCYDVIGFIDGAVAELADAVDADDVAWQDELLADLDTYARNLTDGQNVVEAEGDVQMHLHDLEVQQGVAAAAALCAIIADAQAPAEALDAGQAQLAEAFALMEAARSDIEDLAVAEVIDTLVSQVGDVVKAFAGPSRAAGIMVGIAVDAAGTLTTDLLTAAFSQGGDGLDALDEAVSVGGNLLDTTTDGAAQLLGLGKVTEVVASARDLHGDLQMVDAFTEALAAFSEAAGAAIDLADHLLHEPAARLEAIMGDQALDQLELMQEHLLDGGRWVSETCRAHYEAAAEIRSSNPGRYDRQG